MDFSAILGQLNAGGKIAIQDVVSGLLLSFILGQVMAWVYVYTHAGLSYSRAYVQSVVLLTVIITMSMMVIGFNIAVAFGLIGALSVIRFRNILKDTRDTAFIFLALVVGMAIGVGAYPLAIVGAFFCCGVVLYLHWVNFGSRHIGDGFLRFTMAIGLVNHEQLQVVLYRHCSGVSLLSQRLDADNRGEVSYRLTMRNPALSDRLIGDLREMEGVSELRFVLQEEEAEV